MTFAHKHPLVAAILLETIFRIGNTATVELFQYFDPSYVPSGSLSTIALILIFYMNFKRGRTFYGDSPLGEKSE